MLVMAHGEHLVPLELTQARRRGRTNFIEADEASDEA